MQAALGILAVGLVGTTILQARGVGPSRPAGQPDIAAAPASAAPARQPVAAEGRVVAYPGAEVKVGAEWSGRLVSVRVTEGDTVRRGDLLAQIESDELRAGHAEAQARVVEAEAEVRLAEQNHERRQRLFEEKILAANDLDQANRDIDIARARRDTARATVARYEAQIRKTRILAPIAGSITSRKVDAGQTVEAGDAAFTIADLGRLRIEGEAHEADAAAVAIGAPVAITAEGFPGQSWKGRVEEIPDSVTLRRLKPQDPSRPTDTRILAVKVAFAERSPLKLGTTVELRIEPPAGR
jgi:RND family efflux transporter MFP subunit